MIHEEVQLNTPSFEIVNVSENVRKMTENMLSDALLSKGVEKNFAAAPQASGGRCAGLPPLRGGFHFFDF